MLSADNRIKLSLLGEFGKVAAKRIKCRSFTFTALGWSFTATASSTSHLTAAHARSVTALIHAVSQKIEHLFTDVLKFEP
jgi:hypothetical protein